MGRSALALGAAALSIGARPAGQLDVAVESLRSARGALIVCLTRDPAHFPDCKGDPQARHITLPARDAATRFIDLPTGDYALALIHDENGNGRLDTFAGIPIEGFGFSRNPRLRFGPPPFAAAQFRVEQAETSQDVRIRYLL